MDVNHEESADTASLKKMVLEAFPPFIYTGPITGVDGHPPELDDDGCNLFGEEEDLFESLRGKRWDEISDDVIHRNEDGYLLLTKDAFRAFLPAWLWRGVEDLHAENQVRDFLIYTFAQNVTYHAKENEFRHFNATQLAALCFLMRVFAKTESSKSIKVEAEKAVRFTDDLMRLGPYN